MTFPKFEERAESNWSTSVTQHLVAMPGTVVAGELLIIVFGCFSSASGTTTVTDPSGWTVKSKTEDTTLNRGVAAVYAKIADGTEGGATVDVVTNRGRPAAAHAIRISGWRGVSLDNLALALYITASTNTPNPPSLSASWGAADNLWIVAYTLHDDDHAMVSAPTNYSDADDQISGAGANASCEVATAFRALNASSENPGTFSLASWDAGCVYTMAVHPAFVVVPIMQQHEHF